MSYDPRANGANCDWCPCNHLTPVPPEGNWDTALIAVIGEGPGAQEVKWRKPFIGPSGKKLAEICGQAGINRSQLWITNAILCRAEVPDLIGKKRFDIPTYLAWIRLENRRRKKAGEQHLQNPFDCCQSRLYFELTMMEKAAASRGQPNGAVVMPLGNEALNVIAGRRKISRWRGSPIPLDWSKPIVRSAPEVPLPTPVTTKEDEIPW